MEEISINLNELLEFGENSEENESDINIKSSDKKNFTFDIEGETIKNIEILGLNEKVIFFPVIKYNTLFKGISDFHKSEYIFLFIYLIDDNNIAIFSNNIFEYFKKIQNTKNIFKEKDKEEYKKINNNDFENMTSSFYLFIKDENSKIYKWKSILNFFSTFFNIALEEDTYKNLIYKIKGDSVAFFKSRYMQEKTIKTLISEKKQGNSFINAMFYGNLLKNLTFRIENNLIDLNGKGKGGFNITTLKNNEQYFDKIDKILGKINSVNIEKSNEIPVFFLEGEIGKNDNKELEEYNFIDMFPRVFKNDSKGNIFVLNFKDKEFLLDNKKDTQKVDTSLKDFFDFKKSIVSDFLKFKDSIVCLYEYELLAKTDSKDEKQDKENNELPKHNKKVENNDLFILFSKEKSEGLFLGKIRENCNEQKLLIKLSGKEIDMGNFTNCYAIKEEIKKYLKDNNYSLLDDIKKKIQGLDIKSKQLSCKKCEEEKKKYYIEAYKLHTEIGQINLENLNCITISKKINSSDENNIIFQYGNILNDKVFSFKLKKDKNEKKLNFYIDNTLNNDGLEYFFNGASISGEDMISLGLISQLNKGKILIGDKKTEQGELADIIGFKQDKGSVIIHLIHIKSNPFLVNGNVESYSYYTTAIGQMLQKIEPILMNSTEKFFTKKSDIKKIKDNIYKFIKKLKKSDKCGQYNLVKELELKEDIDIFKIKENFLTKIKNSKKIELRIGIAILKTQFDGKINNKVFYMVNDILLKGFEHTIKPFLNKEVNIIFYPIIIEEKIKNYANI